MRQLRSGNKSPPVHLNDEDNNCLVPDTTWNLNKFSEYYHSIFYRDNLPLSVSSPGAQHDNTIQAFYDEELRSAIQKQRLGGAVGCDGISADMLRAGDSIIISWMTALFNAILSTGHCPSDLKCGLIVPIFKPGKPLGVPKSFRPVMLLSVVRKVLTSVITTRCTGFMQTYVREYQAGFRPGHSTTDGVFYTRRLCERAIIGDWNYSGALLDFSGAFDTVIRESAILRMTDANINTSLIASLVSNTSARVKLRGQLGTTFPTKIGVVQGDPLSPLMFIMYAEGAMRAVDAQCPSLSSLPAPYTQYADDTTLHDSNHQSVKSTVDDCEAVFLKENLKLNVNKTEYFSAAKDDYSWRSVKLLGSRLGTAEDLNARMSAANIAFSTISWKRHSLQSRLTMFQCLIIPILLYNCGLWTLTKALSDKLDIWHRKKLKFLHNIRHPHHISNFALYKLNGSRSLSSICKERRLLWFGHAARQGPSSPTHQALLLAIEFSDVRRPRGRPPLHWIDTVRHDLSGVQLSVKDAMVHALNRKAWLPQIVHRCVKLN